MNGITSAQSATKQNDKLDTLIEKGLFKDALEFGLSEWGPIETWQTVEQCIYAIKLTYQLGGERLSDAILLNHLGLILGSEFMLAHEQTMLADTEIRPQFYAFKSIVCREQKDFETAEQLLDDAQEDSQKNANMTPSDRRFFDILTVRLLLEQDRDEEA
jgi:hypothetical protein